MAERNIPTRIINKHDTEENWNKATNFIPKQGEIIVYDKDSTYDHERVKIGDGVTVVNSLPFIINVDTALSDTSTNPVQNKIVNAALVDKQQVPLIGSTDSSADDYVTPTQAYNAIKAGRDVILTFDATEIFGVKLTFTSFILVEDTSSILASSIEHLNGNYVVCELFGIDNWTVTIPMAVADADVLNTHTSNTTIHIAQDEKDKLAGIEEGANKTVVDSALSDTSENPVQNKVVKSEIESLADAVYTNMNSVTTALTEHIEDTIMHHTVDSALSSTSTNPVQNKVIKAYVDALVIDDGSIG